MALHDCLDKLKSSIYCQLTCVNDVFVCCKFDDAYGLELFESVGIQFSRISLTV